MGDLTDDELIRIETDVGSQPYATIVRLVDEIRRHRSAQVASEELVRSVVRDAIGKFASYVEGNPLGGHGHVANDIATRAAKQLAGAAVGLTTDERADIDALRDSLAEQRQTAISNGQFDQADMYRDWHSALSKLLGAP